jgi:hypothetical protein
MVSLYPPWYFMLPMHTGEHMKIKILAGDLPRETVFYSVPGAIAGEPVASMYEADPVSAQKLVRRASSGGLGNKVCFVAELSSGGKILAQTDARTFKKLLADLGETPVSREFVEEKQGQQKKVGIVILVLLLGFWIFWGRYLQSWIAFVLATFLSMGTGLALSICFSRFGKQARR